jgi:transcriptional regulator with XRE-family HTH domain
MSVRYRLRRLGMLHELMEHPGRGTSYTIRDLAATAGVSRSQIGRLVKGETDNLGVIEAHAVAEALGVAVLVLFMPPVSPKSGQPDTRASHPAERS